MKLVLFDLDDTLLSGDTEGEWVNYMLGQGMVKDDSFLEQMTVFTDNYREGKLDIYEYSNFLLSPVIGIKVEDLQNTVEEFSKEVVRKLSDETTETLLNLHASDECIITSGTLSFLVKEISGELGIQHYFGTDAEIIEGSYTGKVSGIPNFSDEKYGYYKRVQINEEGETQQYSIMENGIYGSPANTETGNINFSIGNILDMKIRNLKDTSNTIKKIKLIESLTISSSYNIFADSLNFSNIRLNARTKILNIFNIIFSSNYDPYMTNKYKNNRINKFELFNNKRLGRLKSFTTSIGLNINNKNFNSNKEADNPEENSNEKDNDSYDIPWSLGADYSLTYDKGNNSAAFSDTIQTLSFSGNIKITKNWKIGFRSGYDFKDKELTYSSIDIYRDLHCWEMLFNWIPIGFHQSYTLTIRVKSSVLRDLKYEKKKDWFTPEYD